MTLDELKTVLLAAFHDTRSSEIEDVDGSLRRLLADVVAPWMHISEKGFAKSDMIHMVEEARYLSLIFTNAAGKLGRLVYTLEDTHEEED